jgi:hypothetical protein
MRDKLTAAILYAIAALANANWLDYGFAEGYPRTTLMSIALVGSGFLGIGCLVSLYRLRYGMILGFIGVCLSWPYFAVLAIALPWRQLVWVITIRYHGIDEMAAIVFLLVATIYSIVQRKQLMGGPA